ncbi:MAG TPA: hypothetical protein VGY31_17635, partial [Terriglobia bacterium]|nr:hypothetical protein [Terriglobia bacterium]
MSTEPNAFPISLAIERRKALIFLPLILLNYSLVLKAQQGCQVPSEFQNPQTTLSMTADSQERVKDVYVLRGHAVMTYRDMRVAADVVTYNDATHEVDARGHVTFDDPKGHLEADSAHYNVLTDSGWFSKVHGYLRYESPQPKQPSTSLFVSADRISRIDQNTYTIQAARLRSCEKENQGLAFGLAEAKVELGNSVSGHSAVFRFLGIPVFYFPYMAVSASRQPRQTGMLLPQVFESNQKGFVLG